MATALTANAPLTFFDTPDRSSADALRAQVEMVEVTPLLATLLESVGSPAAIVNGNREIVLGNEALAALAGVAKPALLGRRLGEVLACTHAAEMPGGCGTTEACTWCGAAQALKEAREHQRRSVNECRIQVTAEGPDTLHLGINASPLAVGPLQTLMVVLRDTSDAQRRQTLERMFFHDALNAAGGLRGLMEVWPDLSPDEAVSLAPAAARLAQQLVDELEAHRDLTAAENGTLAVQRVGVNPAALLDGLRTLFASHEVAEGKAIDVCVVADPRPVATDLVLMRRVLGNLLKNALEASAPGETVRLRFESRADADVFEVHNAAVMPEAARRQVFQRAYTTKGRGRGLGTFGSKLITERYLGGSLSFESAPGLGTTFRVRLPRTVA